ncbi:MULTISPECIES: hypothetical protein [unclassified Enterococcus]|uniref:hypothetical protein n=1 Tax=unclassified Enterococcus TaxID=2608891 RepID=UPI0013ED28CF|nr:MULTISPECIES: hypothetical protein [unclassified Enterococcus]
MKKMRKKEFMKAYNYSASTYQRRMSELKSTPLFCRAYERVTGQEIWSDTKLCDIFLSFKAYNKIRTRKISPQKFIEEDRKNAV